MSEAIAKILPGLLSDCDGSAQGYSHNVAAGLFAIAKAIHDLGTADAATPMGAVEMLAMEVRDGTTRIAEALDRAAGALENIPQELTGIGQEIGWGLDPDDNRSAHIGK